MRTIDLRYGRIPGAATRPLSATLSRTRFDVARLKLPQRAPVAIEATLTENMPRIDITAQVKGQITGMVKGDPKNLFGFWNEFRIFYGSQDDSRIDVDARGEGKTDKNNLSLRFDMEMKIDEETDRKFPTSINTVDMFIGQNDPFIAGKVIFELVQLDILARLMQENTYDDSTFDLDTMKALRGEAGYVKVLSAMRVLADPEAYGTGPKEAMYLARFFFNAFGSLVNVITPEKPGGEALNIRKLLATSPFLLKEFRTYEGFFRTLYTDENTTPVVNANRNVLITAAAYLQKVSKQLAEKNFDGYDADTKEAASEIISQAVQLIETIKLASPDMQGWVVTSPAAQHLRVPHPMENGLTRTKPDPRLETVKGLMEARNPEAGRDITGLVREYFRATVKDPKKVPFLDEVKVMAGIPGTEDGKGFITDPFNEIEQCRFTFEYAEGNSKVRTPIGIKSLEIFTGKKDSIDSPQDAFDTAQSILLKLLQAQVLQDIIDGGSDNKRLNESDINMIARSHSVITWFGYVAALAGEDKYGIQDHYRASLTFALYLIAYSGYSKLAEGHKKFENLEHVIKRQDKFYTLFSRYKELFCDSFLAERNGNRGKPELEAIGGAIVTGLQYYRELNSAIWPDINPSLHRDLRLLMDSVKRFIVSTALSGGPVINIGPRKKDVRVAQTPAAVQTFKQDTKAPEKREFNGDTVLETLTAGYKKPSSHFAAVACTAALEDLSTFCERPKRWFLPEIAGLTPTLEKKTADSQLAEQLAGMSEIKPMREAIRNILPGISADNLLDNDPRISAAAARNILKGSLENGVPDSLIDTLRKQLIKGHYQIGIVDALTESAEVKARSRENEDANIEGLPFNHSPMISTIEMVLRNSNGRVNEDRIAALRSLNRLLALHDKCGYLSQLNGKSEDLKKLYGIEMEKLVAIICDNTEGADRTRAAAALIMSGQKDAPYQTTAVKQLLDALDQSFTDQDAMEHVAEALRISIDREDPGTIGAIIDYIYVNAPDKGKLTNVILASYILGQSKKYAVPEFGLNTLAQDWLAGKLSANGVNNASHIAKLIVKEAKERPFAGVEDFEKRLIKGLGQEKPRIIRIFSGPDLGGSIRSAIKDAMISGDPLLCALAVETAIFLKNEKAPL